MPVAVRLIVSRARMSILLIIKVKNFVLIEVVT